MQVQYSSIAVITGFCQTLLAISTYLGHVSMAQLETVVERVLLRLADGKGTLALEQQVGMGRAAPARMGNQRNEAAPAFRLPLIWWIWAMLG